MKIKNTLIALASLVFLIPTSSQAQFSDLLSFGTGSAFGALGDGSVGTQGPTGVSFTPTVTFGDTFFNSIAMSPTFSLTSPIFLKTTITTNPNVGFSITFNDQTTANRLTSQTNNPGNVVDSGFTYIPLSTVGSPIQSGIEFVTFGWDNSAAANLTVHAISVPEPSTYALMALGGLSLFFIARRRKAQV
jgi:hypothetical protein